ncbi:hypothetical protein KBD61_06315 [Patescibacteria group bacterium]|nr:hypothetical protein [Patescibacteria group bacterium]MBP9710601.1 hypothetical protein [Patescibacteria group bacterium]
MDTFWDLDDLVEKREAFLFMAKRNPAQIEVILQEGEANHVRFVAYTQTLNGLDIVGQTDKDLRRTFFELQQELISVARWSYSVDSFLNDGGDDWLEATIKQYLGERATPEVIATLTLPTFSSFLHEAEILFQDIVRALQADDEGEAQTLAAEYERRYFWIRTNYLVYDRVTQEMILEEAKKLKGQNSASSKVKSKKIEDKAIDLEEVKSKKQGLLDSLEAPQELRSVLRIAEVFTHLQDLRKERVLRLNTFFYPFIQEMERRFNLEHPLGFYLTSEELFGLFDGIQVDLAVIRSRYEDGFLTVACAEGIKIFSMEEFKKEGWNKNFFAEVHKDTEIKGTTAYQGKVEGVVRVLKTLTDIAAFKKGEILVANQTTPEYLPAMKKAVAMVTDQGGITCHAAIVSRELKIPTVIGTKVATRVLKTGDRVEVDAEKGTIRKIRTQKSELKS